MIKAYVTLLYCSKSKIKSLLYFQSIKEINERGGNKECTRLKLNVFLALENMFVFAHGMFLLLWYIYMFSDYCIMKMEENSAIVNLSKLEETTVNEANNFSKVEETIINDSANFSKEEQETKEGIL